MVNGDKTIINKTEPMVLFLLQLLYFGKMQL